MVEILLFIFGTKEKIAFLFYTILKILNLDLYQLIDSALFLM